MGCEAPRISVPAGDLGESAGGPVKMVGQGLLNKLKEEEKAASNGDIVETIKLANIVYAKAQKMCHCKAALQKEAKPAEAKPAVPAAKAGLPKALKGKGLEGKAAVAASKLPLDTAKELAKEVKKSEANSVDDPVATSTKEWKEIQKEEAEEAKASMAAEKAQNQLKVQNVIAEKAADGKDVEK